MRAENDHRLGKYVATRWGGETVRAFVPPPLPPDPPLRLETLQRILEQANQALGRLDGLASLLPDLSLFIYAYVRKEAVLSSQIEGTQSSLSDLLLFENDEAPGVPLEDVQEVSNYVAALGHGLDRLRGGFPLSLRLIREIHAVLLSKGRGSEKQPGEFRTSQNWIGGTRPGNAAFVPPPPDMVMECMGELELFLQAQRSDLPLLIQAGLGPRTIRDDPPVPRRQRPAGAFAHHVSVVRGRRAAGAYSLSEPLLQGQSEGILRTPRPRARDRRLGGVARLLPRRGEGHRRGGGNRSAPHPRRAGSGPPQDRIARAPVRFRPAGISTRADASDPVYRGCRS